MKMRPLGRTGIDVSEVGLGTWAFASQIYGDVDIADAEEAVRYALDAGVNLFDTAPLYGTSKEDGVSETILGRALGADRERVLISTKFGRYATDKAAPNFHASRARESVEGSLRRLRTDHVDILFFHSPFSSGEIHDDVWTELDKLKAEGKVRVIGHSISMFEETASMARDWVTERQIDVIQVVYSLMNRQSTNLIGDVAEMGAGVVARESLANGFLSGTVRRDTVFSTNNINKRYSTDEIEERIDYVEQLDFLVRRDVRTLPQAAVRWVLDNPDVSCVLSGAKNRPELQDWVRGSDARPFTDEELDRADNLHDRDFQAA